MLRLSHAAPTRVLLTVLCTLLVLAITGCAGLAARDPVRINVVGINPLAGQGLEMRFNLRLRVQNPNETQLDFDGVAVELDLNGRPFATGVSDAKATVPRFGETVFAVPVTVSAFAALEQVLALADGATLDNVPYTLRGKLAGGLFGTMRFKDKGTLTIPGTGQGGR